MRETRRRGESRLNVVETRCETRNVSRLNPDSHRNTVGSLNAPGARLNERAFRRTETRPAFSRIHLDKPVSAQHQSVPKKTADKTLPSRPLDASRPRASRRYFGMRLNRMKIAPCAKFRAVVMRVVSYFAFRSVVFFFHAIKRYKVVLHHFIHAVYLFFYTIRDVFFFYRSLY